MKELSSPAQPKQFIKRPQQPKPCMIHDVCSVKYNTPQTVQSDLGDSLRLLTNSKNKTTSNTIISIALIYTTKTQSQQRRDSVP